VRSARSRARRSKEPWLKVRGEEQQFSGTVKIPENWVEKNSTDDWEIQTNQKSGGLAKSKSLDTGDKRGGSHYPITIDELTAAVAMEENLVKVSEKIPWE